MNLIDKTVFWVPALALVVGLGLLVYAIVSGSSWAVLTGAVGFGMAIKAAIHLARRSGASDQPQ